MHCHYPMHLLVEEPDPRLERMVRIRRPYWVNKLRAALLALAARLLNYRQYNDHWRVDLEGLEASDVCVVFSVLYQPFAEIDFDEPAGAPPEPGYFTDLNDQLRAVEQGLLEIDPQRKRHQVATNLAELDLAVSENKVAFLHCVEGGFHLGATADEVKRNVEDLAGKGVVYVTLAHLFWRQVATNANALPFLPDAIYKLFFCQPNIGLAPLGEAAVDAMYRHRVLIDLSHMNQNALDKTFARLRGLDEEHGADPKDFPVIVSHGAFRCGRQSYTLSAETVEAIAARDGVIGLILAQHQLNDGIVRGETKDFEQTMEVICRHVSEIHRVTGSYDNIGIGTDLDGFIKPTMTGLEYASDLWKLREPLEECFPGQSERILSQNALRVVRKVLAARTPS